MFCYIVNRLWGHHWAKEVFVPGQLSLSNNSQVTTHDTLQLRGLTPLLYLLLSLISLSILYLSYLCLRQLIPQKHPHYPDTFPSLLAHCRKKEKQKQKSFALILPFAAGRGHREKQRDAAEKHMQEGADTPPPHCSSPLPLAQVTPRLVVAQHK